MTLPARLYQARQHAVFGLRSHWLPDLLAGTASCVAAATLSWPLLSARDLDTGAGDWPAHAFRVREVLDHGIASWSHTWAGGMPLWEGYQAAPHLLTAAVVSITGLGITQAMVVLAGLLLVMLRAGTYLAGRMVGASPVAALIGALVVCVLDSVRQPVANYSELWGLALTPLLLAAAYRWSGHPAGLIVAALSGLAIEMHPHLAAISALGLALGYVASRRERSAVILVVQMVLVTTGAAVFWLPVLTSSRPAFIEPYFVSAEFADLLLSLATAGFLPGWPAIAAAAVFVGLVALHRCDSARAVVFLLLCGLGVAVTVSVSLLDQAPLLVRTAQLPRIIGVTPILIGLLIAVLLTIALRRIDGERQAWAAALALFALAWALDRGRPLPAIDTVRADSDPVAQMIGRLDRQIEGRVMADPVLTAYASAADDGAMRYAGSYSGWEWSILNGPARFYLGDYGTPAMRAAYLMAHGVEFLVVRSGARPAIADPASGTPLSWRQIDAAGGFDLLQAPWSPAMAWHLDREKRAGFTVPDSTFRDTESAYVRDVIVGRLAVAAMRDPTARTAVEYPDGERIVVNMHGLDGNRYLVINENWGSAWQATVNGETRSVERFGANQIGIDLAGVAGDATVVLRHSWPATQVAGLALTLASLPVAVLLWAAFNRIWTGGVRR